MATKGKSKRRGTARPALRTGVQLVDENRDSAANGVHTVDEVYKYRDRVTGEKIYSEDPALKRISTRTGVHEVEYVGIATIRTDYQPAEHVDLDELAKSGEEGAQLARSGGKNREAARAARAAAREAREARERPVPPAPAPAPEAPAPAKK